MNACYIARNRNVAARQLGDELIMMSAVDSTLFNLNAVAGAIWQAADGQTSLAEIVEQKICSIYEVEFDEALRDARQFVVDLAAHGILLVSDSPIPDSNAAVPATP